jgi:hypothetical protein
MISTDRHVLYVRCPPNQPVAVNTTSDWCNVCQNTQNRGCDEIASAASQGRAQALAQQHVDPIGAGFLGAGLALAVSAALLAILYFSGFLSFGKKHRNVIPSTVSSMSGGKRNLMPIYCVGSRRKREKKKKEKSRLLCFMICKASGNDVVYVLTKGQPQARSSSE